MKILIDKVLEQIEHDVSTGDITAIEELIKGIPIKNLEAFLSYESFYRMLPTEN